MVLPNSSLDRIATAAGLQYRAVAACQPPNKQLQRTVRNKVPRHMGQRAAAELRR